MRLADHGADDGFFIQRVTHCNAFGAFAELLHKVSVNALLHQDATARRAPLAVVAENHEHRSIECAV